ncbi:PIH1 domain-containing protein 2 [Hondaea fermentalgiana]|uniref:PIH1 domain-containing protein 2 n=1 Tax=Hondaea fermentalgiana TaxID=2315210 RepID=A0A2R5GTM0_9STRA|nr:PIH1 domain-containing protein 2 [Hondaea fermentalgiana]|eukprot:GBG33669.1 PIH1 domain-containing protein 2 [Hondaea fermentalgiana]
MNSAKSLRRAGRGQGGKMSLSAAMRQLGIDKESLPKQEAEELWNMLNNMADKDPDGYKDFIRNQMDEAKQDEDNQVQRRGFRPEKGFAIRTSYVQNDAAATTTKPVYINLCGCKAVEMPRDAAGTLLEPTKTAKPNLTGLNIPLAVGTLRDCINPDSGDDAHVLDVVFHPWVTEQACEFSSFQAQIIELALTWCEAEARGKLSRKYATLPRAYYGTDPMGMTAFFPVGEDPTQSTGASASASKSKSLPSKDPKADVMARPETLLGALREETKADETQSTKEIKLQQKERENNARNTPIVLPGGIGPRSDSVMSEKDKQPKPKPEKKPKVQQTPKKLVQEVSKAPKRAAVKKGFLENTNGALYGEAGSSEGAPTSLYQKAKIVDLNKMSPEEVQKVMQEHGGGGPLPSAAGAQQARPPKEKQSLSNAAASAKSENDKRDDTRKMLEHAFESLSKEEKDAFEKFAEAADLEFAKRNVNDQDVQPGLEGLFGDLTKSMGSLGALFDTGKPGPAQHSTKEAKAPASEPETIGDATSTHIALAPAPHKLTENVETGEIKLVLDVGTSCTLADIDVEISEHKVRLVSKGNFADTPIRLPTAIDRESARAKLSKKTGKLTIKATMKKR